MGLHKILRSSPPEDFCRILASIRSNFCASDHRLFCGVANVLRGTQPIQNRYIDVQTVLAGGHLYNVQYLWQYAGLPPHRHFGTESAEGSANAGTGRSAPLGFLRYLREVDASEVLALCPVQSLHFEARSSLHLYGILHWA